MLPIYTIDASQIAYVVLVDEIIHDATRPFCSDPNCECHEDSDLVREHITKPLDNGLITNSEALRVYWCKQLGQLHDTPITDEEPNIVDRRNEWNGYEQGMARESAEEEWRRATDNRDFEPDDPISVEEIEQVMNEPSPLEVDIEENYHRTFFDGLDLDDLEDHPF